MYPFYLKIADMPHKELKYKSSAMLMKSIQKIYFYNLNYSIRNTYELKIITKRIMSHVKKEYPNKNMTHREFVNLCVRDYIVEQTYSPLDSQSYF